MKHKQEEPRIGRPPLDDDSESVSKSIRLTAQILKDTEARVKAAGDLSKYIRKLIKRDLKEFPDKKGIKNAG